MEPSTKRSRLHLSSSMQEDRLSSLNDHLLHHILSFLPTNLVIRTSVLSPRWKQLWSTSPHIRLDDSLFRSSPAKPFMNFAERALLLLSPPTNLLSFRLSSTSPCNQLHRIESWLRWALAHNVQQLRLHTDNPKNFQLPSSLFRSSSLKVLRLSQSHCDPLHWPSQSRLPSLEILHLSGILFGPGAPSNLISSCHSCLRELSLEGCKGLDSLTMDRCRLLESLGIESCAGLQKLAVSAGRLRKLRVVDSFDGSTGSGTSFTVSAPRLESFVWSGLPAYQFSSKGSMASIRCSSIRYSNAGQNLTARAAGFALKLLMKLSDGRKLIINTACINILGAGARGHLKNGKEIHKFNNIEELRAVIGFGVVEAVDMVCVLKSCPNLKKLVIVNTELMWDITFHQQYIGDLQTGGYWKSQGICLKHLIEVKFIEFKGTDYETDFIKFLVQHLSTLQKLTIMTSVSTPSRKHSEIAQMLAALPSASSNLRLLFLSP